MKPDFDYNIVPHGFYLCFNKQCKHADQCLRYLVTKYCTPEHIYINTLNPAYIATVKDECPHFKPDQMRIFALGMTHLLDNVPLNDAIKIKKLMIGYFNRSTYYRCCRKERLITPSEQEFIKNLFMSKGITGPPLFDEYIEQYDW